MKYKYLLLILLFCLPTIILSATTIYDIQYTTIPGSDGTYPSTMEGQTVTVTGIVTANNYYSSGNSNRFFMSALEGGAWNGIFVFNYDYIVELGDEVEVTGKVSEYYGFTEIGNVTTLSILSSGNQVPAPVEISTNELANEEAYEGVLVRISNVTVTQTPNEHGEWYVNDDSGQCQIDDTIYEYPNPQIGDEFISITGAVDYSYDEYGLNPRSDEDFVTGSDITPPTITSANATSSTNVNLVFNEKVSQETAEVVNNYTINGLTISEANLQTDGKTVTLTTSEQIEDEIYTITVNNVEDLAGNVILPNSTIDFTGYSTGGGEIDLFFSEYIEGSSQNKALEIYNGTDSEISLSNYRIAQSVNGNGWQYWHIFPDGASIASGDVWVITTNEADGELQAVADEILSYPSVVHFNGNDARGLEKTTDGGSTWTLIDVIGIPNENPGDGWNVAGVTNATKDHTLVKKATITQGNTDWNSSAGTNTDNSEWIVYPQDTFEYLGSHNAGGGDTSPPILVSANATSSTTVNLVFSEKISQETAETISNYTIDELTVSNAALQTDEKTVILTTSEQTEGEIYTIIVNNVEDLAGNVIEPNSIITFTGFAGDTTPPQINFVLAASETTVQITFSEAINDTMAEDKTNYSISPFLAITEAKLEDGNEVLLTTDEQTSEETYSLTVMNIEDLHKNVIVETTVVFIGFQPEEYDLIADIQADPESYEGQEVTICGVVTIGVNVIQTDKTNAYVQDNSGRGINIFDYNVIEELFRANLVEVTGEVEEYVDSYGNATTEIKNPVVTVLDTGYAEPEPLKINLNQASDVSLEGTLLQVTGEIYEVYSAGGGTNLNIEDEQGNQLTVRVWDTTNLDLSEYIVGYILQATGIGNVYSGKLQIVPGYQDQLTEGQIDGYENIEIEPESPSTYEPVTITFTYSDTCKSVELFWNTIKGNEFKSTYMDFIDSTQYSYTAEIPGQSEGTIVYFYITAFDTSDSVSYFPENAPKELYQYEYKVESLKAVLKVPHHTFCPALGEKFEIQFNSRQNDKIILRLYNSEGKLVTTFRNENSAGLSSFEWDGKDDTWHTLPPGLYICHLEVIDRKTGKTKTDTAPIVIAVPLKD